MSELSVAKGLVNSQSERAKFMGNPQEYLAEKGVAGDSPVAQAGHQAVSKVADRTAEIGGGNPFAHSDPGNVRFGAAVASMMLMKLLFSKSNKNH